MDVPKGLPALTANPEFLIPNALGPGLRSGQGGPALATELSNQDKSLSSARLFEIKAKKKKKIKYQNFEGSVSIADVFLWPQTPVPLPRPCRRDPVKHPDCSAHSRPHCCRDITVRVKAQSVCGVSAR